MFTAEQSPPPVANNARFFEYPQAAAIYKHQLLKSYMPVFIGKTGSRSTGGRVVVYDAYSGPGRYLDDQPGSPELLVDTATSMAELRSVHTIFSERDQSYCDALERVMAEKDVDPTTYEIRRGPVEKHIDSILADAGDLPLFVFLDPYGLSVSFAQLVHILTARHRPGLPSGYQPKTEVLLNFSYEALRRIAGALRTERNYSAKAAQVARLDDGLGGDWWQDVALDQADDWISEILGDYARRVRDAAGGGGYITAPVADSASAQPVYELILFTAHPDGVWEMLNAMSTARRAWRDWLAEHQEQLAIEGLTFDDDEDAWIDYIAANMAAILDERGAFTVGNELGRVFGRTLGLARETHITKALRLLKKHGRIPSVPTGSKQHVRVIPS